MPDDEPEKQVELTVLVPSDKVGRFYELLGTLYIEPDDHGRWRADDQAVADEVYAACGPINRKFLLYLAERPGQGVDADELAKPIGRYDAKTLASMTGSIGRATWKRNRKVPWDMPAT